MPRRRQAAELNLAAEINVTSLVDVAFVLLLIFIITAPVMQGGVEVRMVGRALDDAGARERISVENVSSRRVVQGVVSAQGDVIVGR